MKLAIPSETDAGLEIIRSGHFGHAPFFTIVEIEDGKVVSASSVKNADHDAVGCGGVIEYAMSLGIDAMLAVGMGLPPLTRFNAAGIKVYSERNTPVVGDAVQIFLMGLCPEMRAEDACRH